MPIVFKYLIEFAAKNGAPIDWCMILPTPEHRALVRSVLPRSDILDVYRALPRVPVGGDLGLLAEYPGSLAEDLGADKRPWGARGGRKRFARGVDYHLHYKRFLIERGATYFLAPQIEGAEGKIAVATARQLGLPVMVAAGFPLAYGHFFRRRCLRKSAGSRSAARRPAFEIGRVHRTLSKVRNAGAFRSE